MTGRWNRLNQKATTGFLAQNFSPESVKMAIFEVVISLLRDDFEPEPYEPGTPCSAVDIAFWKDVFSVLLPPESDEKSESDKSDD